MLCQNPCHISKLFHFTLSLVTKVHSLSGSSSQRGFLLHEGLDTIDHVLDKLLLGLSESSLVGDVENTIIGLSVLSVDTSDLDFVIISDLVEGFFVSHEFGELDVDRSSHGSSKVGWARGDVTKMVVMSEFADSF